MLQATLGLLVEHGALDGISGHLAHGCQELNLARCQFAWQSHGDHEYPNHIVPRANRDGSSAYTGLNPLAGRFRYTQIQLEFAADESLPACKNNTGNSLAGFFWRYRQLWIPSARDLRAQLIFGVVIQPN